MNRIERKTFEVKDKFGLKQLLVVEKVQPENEAQHLHVFEVVTHRDGRRLAINHVRLHGREFNRGVWMRRGWHRDALDGVVNRYFDTVAKVRAEARMGG